MAAGEDGEHTRFPCLAMVRYAVATVVTVLAAAVVVMAIHVVFRSEDVHLSIDYGYIEADGLWSVTEANGGDELPLPTEVVTQANIGSSSSYRSRRSSARSSSSSSDSTTTVRLQKPVPAVTVTQSNYNPQVDDYSPQPLYLRLRVILSAHNPGGRSKIDCNKTTIRVLDMRNAYQEIVKFELDDFTVPQQTAHTQTKRVVVNDTTVLAYIKEQYHGETSFRVMVQVDAIITSYPLGRKTNSNNQTYFCWPVTVGLIAYGTLPDTNVACKTREETQLRVGPLPLPLAPAPAPAPTGSKAS